MLRPHDVGNRVHSVPQLIAGTDSRRDTVGKRHRQRTAQSLTAFAIDDNGPGATAHAAIGQLNHAALEAHRKLGTRLLERRQGAISGTALGLLVAHRLIGHAALHLDALDLQRGLEAREHGADGGELDGITRADGNAHEGKAHGQWNRCEKAPRLVRGACSQPRMQVT